jgi:hypothetical protein
MCVANSDHLFDFFLHSGWSALCTHSLSISFRNTEKKKNETLQGRDISVGPEPKLAAYPWGFCFYNFFFLSEIIEREIKKNKKKK